MKSDLPSLENIPRGLEALCQALAPDSTGGAGESIAPRDWLEKRIRICADHRVFHWFVPESLGGAGWSGTRVVGGYLAMAKTCLATTFVVTQWAAAVRRIVASENRALAERLMPDLLDGTAFTTVGISHLTTSRQHLARPAVSARRDSTHAGYRIDGTSPWVTAGGIANIVVLGATCEDGQQLLVALPTAATGVSIGEHQQLLALTESMTGPVHCEDVFIADEGVIAGPADQVMQAGAYSGSGGLQTSTLALGHASAAIEDLQFEAQRRPALADVAKSLRFEWNGLAGHLWQAASGQPSLPHEELRFRANSLVLRATQAALVAAKGAGFAAGHPAGRRCMQAMFFLVWSCPQAVQDANLCELATPSIE
jgi:alkylation response protein AidB-like acyl-CoA dehydrogenase